MSYQTFSLFETSSFFSKYWILGRKLGSIQLFMYKCCLQSLQWNPKHVSPDWCVPHNLRLVEKRQVMGRLSLEVWVLKVVDNFCLASLMWFEDTSLWSTTWRLKLPMSFFHQDMLDSWKSNVANQLMSQCHFPSLQAVPPRAEPRRGGTSWDTPNCRARRTCRPCWQIWQNKFPHFVHFMPCGSLEVYAASHVGLKRSLSIWFGGLGSVSMSTAPCAPSGEKYELKQLVVERLASSFGKSSEFTVIVEEANRKRNWSYSSTASDDMKPRNFWGSLNLSPCASTAISCYSLSLERS